MPKKEWRIAYVCPRYTPQSAGGAEVLIQSWAERMRERGHHSEVLTTCARDHITWENEYPAGAEEKNGIVIRRFPVDPRDLERQSFCQEKLLNGQELSRREEEDLIRGGVSSEAIYDYIRGVRDDFDCFIFAPYLFGVTYYGLRLVPEKSIIVPCLHDEPYAYLKVIRDLFAEAAGVFFNSRPERDLARRLFDLDEARTRIVGMGIDARDSLDPESFRAKYKVDCPFLFYAGRREDGKNTPLLLEYFRQFRRAQKTDLRLLLIGTGDLGLKRSDRGVIEDLGYIPEADKWNGYAASLALCQPSTNESFSIVLLESWLAGRPALVNAFCPVTLDHCQRSSGGLYFRDYFEFEECLLYLLENPKDANAMGGSGRGYVRENFAWDEVLNRLEEGINQCLRH